MTDPRSEPRGGDALPCPFCAELPAVIYDEDEAWSVGCKNPRCIIAPSLRGFLAQPDAVATWNRRGLPGERRRGNAFAKIIHELIRPDNGVCNQCGGHWLYRDDGSWDYLDGEHLESCVARRVIEADIEARRAPEDGAGATWELLPWEIRVPKSIVVGDVNAASACRVYVEDGQHWMQERDGSVVPLIILRAERVRVV